MSQSKFVVISFVFLAFDAAIAGLYIDGYVDGGSWFLLSVAIWFVALCVIQIANITKNP